MKQKELQEFCSYLSRSYLIEAMKETNKLTPELKTYIIKEMSYDNVMIMAFGDREIITEGAAEQQAEKIKKREKIEKVISKYIGTSLAVLAGAAGAVAGGKHASNKIHGTDGLEIAGVIGGALGGAVIAGGLTKLRWWIISKIVGFIYSKSTNTCTDKYGKNNSDWRKCMFKANQIVINRLKKELSKCNTTDNPDKCKNHLNRLLEKQQKKQQKYS